MRRSLGPEAPGGGGSAHPMGRPSGAPVIPLSRVRAVLKCVRLFFLVLAAGSVAYFVYTFSQLRDTAEALDILADTPSAFVADDETDLKIPL